MTNTWEPDRNVLSLKGKKVGTTNISSYDYTVNAIGERTNVSQTGTAFGSARDITWGYDSLGQVTSADSTIPGLLAVAIHDQQSSIFYPLFDGNGNVSEYLDSAGAVQGHYEYDPLGGITVATGAKSADFSHRFSTKPLDTETGLYY